jgi:uncharacterized spore protein YtfJ
VEHWLHVLRWPREVPATPPQPVRARITTMPAGVPSTPRRHRPRLELPSHEPMQEATAMNVDEMLAGAREAMTVKKVYGDPIERDGITIIPAARVSGGGGGGGDAQQNAGGGFGVSARPVGAYVVRGSEVTWEPALDVTRTAMMGMLTGIVALLVLRSVLKALFTRR